MLRLQTALLAHLAGGTLTQGFALFEMTFGQIPHSAPEHHQNQPLGRNDCSTGCLYSINFITFVQNIFSMDSTATTVASALLQINAIKLSPANLFTWASGWRSPIYCDNRRVLSHPEVRGQVRDAFVELVRAKYPDAEVIAGVATGAIAHGVLVAEALGLPFVYVRSAPKGHGLENLIEGEYTAGQRVVVIEDLISTGGSSLAAVEALRAAGLDVLGMAAIFTYGFPTAARNFAEAGVELDTLSDYPTLIALARERGYVSPEEVETLRKWRENPSEF
jgi:orotate phosphoribosyltransferase